MGFLCPDERGTNVAERDPTSEFGFYATASESSENQWLFRMNVKQHFFAEDGQEVAPILKASTLSDLT